MKPAPFEYHAPDSLEHALALMAEHGGDAKLLAGGQSLVPAMNFRVAQPAMLVDLNGLSELDYIRRDGGGGLLIGAMTRQRTVERSQEVAKADPLLYETMPYIAHPQIRNRGTVGGSLAHADPASELPVIAIARDARMKAASASGERWIDARDFFLGFFTTGLQPEEILVEVALPPMPARAGWSFMEVSRRHGDYAMMGVGALVTTDSKGACAGARLVYLNAGDGPVEAVEAAGLLKGQKPTEQAVEAAAVKASEEEIDPFGNVHATVDYQRHLARVLTQRALKIAFERARGSGK